MDAKDKDQRPTWDRQRAETLIGATVLIGITQLGSEAAEYEQMFGVIRSADVRNGVEIALEGSRRGETYGLPPDLRNFSPARPGEYRLRGTGEIVANPDPISTWTIHPPEA